MRACLILAFFLMAALVAVQAKSINVIVSKSKIAFGDSALEILAKANHGQQGSDSHESEGSSSSSEEIGSDAIPSSQESGWNEWQYFGNRERLVDYGGLIDNYHNHHNNHHNHHHNNHHNHHHNDNDNDNDYYGGMDGDPKEWFGTTPQIIDHGGLPAEVDTTTDSYSGGMDGDPKEWYGTTPDFTDSQETTEIMDGYPKEWYGTTPGFTDSQETTEIMDGDPKEWYGTTPGFTDSQETTGDSKEWFDKHPLP